MSDKKHPIGRDRPFPWFCIECREKQVFPLTTDFTISAKHDEDSYVIRISDLEIPTCRKCGERVFSGKEDDRIVAALRAAAGILTPEEIQARRNQLGISQREMAGLLGVPQELFDKWETGMMIQTRAMDNLLRLYFESEESRTLLSRFRAAAAQPRIGLPAGSALPAETVH